LNLRHLEITREQLIDIAILIGTDYNDKLEGVGAKTALKWIKQYGSLEKIEKEREIKLDFPYGEIRDIFLNPPKMEVAEPKWADPDRDAIVRILCGEHDFSSNRVEKSLERLDEALKETRDSTHQSSLTDFF
jgi:flap endonuclease-1